MNPRHWWLGITMILLALLAHAALPRYEWRAVAEHPTQLVRVDRWTGQAQLGQMTSAGWVALHP